METLKKATKILSIVDVVLCLLVVVSFSVFYFFADNFELTDNAFDFTLWTVIVFFVLALTAIVFFALAVIILSICSKKIIKEKSVVIAHIVNIIFVLLILYFMSQTKVMGDNLFFIFA